MQMADDNDWKNLFGAARRPDAKSPCPQAETVSTWAEGALSVDAVAHLATCASCREDLVVLRRQRSQKTERVSGDLRSRLYALQAKPSRPKISPP